MIRNDHTNKDRKIPRCPDFTCICLLESSRKWWESHKLKDHEGDVLDKMDMHYYKSNDEVDIWNYQQGWMNIPPQVKSILMSTSSSHNLYFDI